MSPLGRPKGELHRSAQREGRPVSERLLADAVVVFHLLFIAFAVAGGALVLRWPRLALLHLPAAA